MAGVPRPGPHTYISGNTQTMSQLRQWRASLSEIKYSQNSETNLKTPDKVILLWLSKTSMLKSINGSDL